MDLFTHATIGAFIFLQFFRGFHVDFIYWAIFCAILPDLDIFLIPLKKKFNSKYFEHRGGSHSFFSGILVSAIISPIFVAITKQNYFTSWIIGMLFYSLHVSMDLLTTTKIPILFPISKKEYSFYVEKAGSLFTMFISVIFLIIYSPFYFTSAEHEILMSIINSFSLFYLFYYLYRITTKLWYKRRIDNDQIYLPAVLPFKFAVFSFIQKNNKIITKLIMKIHFSKEELLYQNDVTMTPEETEFLNRSLELCRSEYYFSKWTLLPILLKNEDFISVRIFFLETLINKKTSYIQYDFDELTQEMQRFHRGFSSINFEN